MRLSSAVLDQDLDAPPQVDFIQRNSRGRLEHSNPGLANVLMNSNNIVDDLRPYIGRDGRSYVSRTVGYKEDGTPITKGFVTNSFAALPRDAWIEVDSMMQETAKPRMRAFNELRQAGTYTIPDGYGVTMLQTQRVSDITGAYATMSGITPVDADRPAYDVLQHPCPVIHKDCFYDLRQIKASRRVNQPLDLETIQLATRRVAEYVEMLTIGTVTGITFNGATIYGYTNFPGRITGSLTYAPTNGSWTPLTTVTDVMAMKAALMANFHYGPYTLYYGQAWAPYIEKDYSVVTNITNQTLRERLLSIKEISEVQQLDYLHSATDFSLILKSNDSFTARAVVGMELSTLQWEVMGGLELHMKVMCIMSPQLRVDIYGNSGIAHYS